VRKLDSLLVGRIGVSDREERPIVVLRVGKQEPEEGVARELLAHVGRGHAQDLSVVVATAELFDKTEKGGVRRSLVLS
jgi:hypothetical protein